MEANENQENVKALVKLGIDTEDIAKVYLNITEKGADISKEAYINNLTEILKFFQTRNNNIENEANEAIFKEDVLNMLKKNKNLIGINIDKKLKPMCEKIDSYYFMNSGYTNNLIKNDPKIFNLSNINLEIYSTILSDFAIKLDTQTVNMFEYIIKQESYFLQNDVQKVFGRMMYIKDNKKSKLFTKEEVDLIGQELFCVNDEELKEKYKLPIYNGENLSDYKQKIMRHLGQSEFVS